MLGIKRIDHIPNTTIYEKPDTKPLIYLLQQEQLQFIGHVLRMNKEEPIYTISWQKHRGRQPTTFLSYIKKLLGYLEGMLTTAMISKTAQDRATSKQTCGRLHSMQPNDDDDETNKMLARFFNPNALDSD